MAQDNANTPDDMLTQAPAAPSLNVRPVPGLNTDMPPISIMNEFVVGAEAQAEVAAEMQNQVLLSNAVKEALRNDLASELHNNPAIDLKDINKVSLSFTSDHIESFQDTLKESIDNLNDEIESNPSHKDALIAETHQVLIAELSRLKGEPIDASEITFDVDGKSVSLLDLPEALAAYYAANPEQAQQDQEDMQVQAEQNQRDTQKANAQQAMQNAAATQEQNEEQPQAPGGRVSLGLSDLASSTGAAAKKAMQRIKDAGVAGVVLGSDKIHRYRDGLPDSALRLAEESQEKTVQAVEAFKALDPHLKNHILKNDHYEVARIIKNDEKVAEGWRALNNTINENAAKWRAAARQNAAINEDISSKVDDAMDDLQSRAKGIPAKIDSNGDVTQTMQERLASIAENIKLMVQRLLQRFTSKFGMTP